MRNLQVPELDLDQVFDEADEFDHDPDHDEIMIGAFDDLDSLLSGRFEQGYGAIGAYDIVGQQEAQAAAQSAREMEMAQLSARMQKLREIDPNAVAVTQRQLTTRRRLLLGFTPAIDVQPGDAFELRAEIQEVFRTERVIIPSEITPFVIINDAKVGTVSQFANSAPVPAAMFSEVSTFVNVDWRTANVGNDVVILCVNIGTDPIDVYAGAIGTTALGM
jgi:hypothetical protein